MKPEKKLLLLLDFKLDKGFMLSGSITTAT